MNDGFMGMEAAWMDGWMDGCRQVKLNSLHLTNKTK
jgi:hypothetical protein